ncbi:MAG: hypothetical protein QM611_06960 [Microbacterium sp.]|uniref:hypothetical protein n=1 Tax=Microbacterium sp. TaxID=51671 RepID=UPI0039E4B3FD
MESIDLISSVPRARAARRESPSTQYAQTGINTTARIGWDAARPSLESAPGALRPMETFGEVLPELEEAPAARRPLWRHPAFLVSIGTTLLAIVAAVVFLLLGGGSQRAVASDLQLEVTENAVRVTWSGPDAPYQVVVVGGPAGAEVDVSQTVTGTEAWLPRAAGLVDDRSCIVVRPADGNEKAPVSLERATLDEQGAVAGCVSDAASE